MAEVSLYDSAICRLCAEDNGNGELLYAVDGDEQDLSSMVNRYLPIKIRDDGKLPRTICPGCNIQLEATVQFFELLVDGQRKIREMWKQQVEVQRKNERERLRAERENTELAIETPELDNFYTPDGDDQFSQQIIIKIMPDGSMYAAEHDMSLQMEGLDKPRRKRGRPPKSLAELDSKLGEDAADGASQEEEEKLDDEADELDGDGRRRRKRKVPKRFSEAVQGKELERIFKEEGVIDDDDDDGPDNTVDDPEERVKVPTPDGHEEIIGHLESEEGKDLGELVIVNRARGRGRPKLRRRKNKFHCNLCGRGFLQRSRYIMHKSFHNGIKYQCSECKKQFTNKENCALHQKTTGHSGSGIIEGLASEEANVQVAEASPVESEKSSPVKVSSFEKPSEEDASAEKLGPEENSNPETLDQENSSLEKACPAESEDTPKDAEDTQIEESKDESSGNEQSAARSSSPETQSQIDMTKPFDCRRCKISFGSRKLFEGHLRKTHNGDKPFACTLCNKTFAYQAGLQGHLATHETYMAARSSSPESQLHGDHETKPFDCGPCKLSFGTKKLFEAHLRNAHNGEKPFRCTECTKTFAYRASLETHMSTHARKKQDRGQGHPCDICGKVLNHPSSVIYHKEAEHNGRRFVCNKCGKSFKHKQLLQRHQLVHSDDRPYVCGSCNASFKTKANLINHQFTHTGEKKYSCELCGQQFAHKTSLTLHYRWHTGHKPYSCEVCNKTFSQNGNLQEHMRIHTGEKPYSCDHCGRKFTTSSQFKLHVKRHTGERPWKCEFCAKTFLHKDTWKCHVRRHKGERPFQCAHCNRGFTEQWALKKHLRLHTGEKPYSCDVCGKAFADCSNLTKHKKVHRENKVLGINELSKAAAGGELWQILPNSQDGEEHSLGEHVTQVFAGEETSEDGIPQIIYVSYQDPDDPNQNRTLHFVDVGVVEDKEGGIAAVESGQSLPTLEVANSAAPGIAKRTVQEVQEESTRETDMVYDESNIHLQITDEEGNPIPLSIQDARQLLSDGRFVSQLNDGQAIRISDELAQQLNLQVNQSAEMETIESTRDASSTAETDAEAIVKVLEDEDTDATAVAAVNQMAGEAEIDDGAQTIEFTTQDGQKVRLVTSYHVDPMQLASEYLSIV